MTAITPQDRRLTLIAVLVVFLLSALDQTIVSTAMPRIVSELKGLELYSWVTTAYLLSSTVMVPIWGKLGDIYGRKVILLTGIGIFVFGSWLCGLSGEFGDLPVLGSGMTQLIVFRAIQGIGGGALFTSAFAVIADLFPPRERAKFSGLFGGVFGLASVVGPVIGGFFTEHGSVDIGGLHVAGWRWVFYLNLPLSLLAMFMIAFKAPQLGHRRPGRIDWAGAALIVATFVPLLLALSWGGHTYPWASPVIIGLLVGSLAMLALLLWVETQVINPVVPLQMFKIRTFWTANLASFIISMSFLGVVTYLPLYLQLGLGAAATQSGIAMLPLMGGLILASTVCGQLVTRTGRYKPFMLGGGAMLLIGVFLLTRLDENATVLSVSWRVFIVGLGLGPAQSLFSLAIQNAVPASQLGVSTSASQFFRQIGSTIGVALFGALMTARLATHMATAHGGGSVSLSQLQGAMLQGAAEGAGAKAMAVEPWAKAAFTAAMTDVFLVSLVVIAVGIFAVSLIPALPLRRHSAPEPVAQPGEGEG